MKLVSYSDFQFYFIKVLRNFDGMISQAVTDNLEHGGVEVCRRTQVKMGLTWGWGGDKKGNAWNDLFYCIQLTLLWNIDSTIVKG